jgi:hypothetical protein
VPPQLPLLNRVRAYALMQGGRLDEARAALQESLAAGRARQADYEIGVTLRAMVELAGTSGEAIDAAVAAESREILDRMGVVAIPEVPLQATPTVTVRDAEPVARRP